MASDWQRALVAMAVTVIGIAIVAVLYWARVIFIPLALAIFLAFVLAPVVSRLQRRGLGRTPAVVVTVGLVILLSVGVGAVVGQQLSQLADKLPDRAETIKQKVLAAKMWVVGDGQSRFGKLVDDVVGIIAPETNGEREVVVKPASTVGGQVESFLSPAAEFLGQAAFTFILTVFMLMKREDLRNRVIRLLGEGRVTTTTKAVDDASQRISRFLLRQLMLNVAFGMVVTVGLFALGVSYAILFGFIATVMRYVPYIGTWIGLIPPVLYSFATAPEWGGGWGQPLGVLALFLGLEALCNNVIEPTLYGRSMGLSEVAQLVAAAFWAFLWGPIGLILSGPLTVCLLVLGRHVRRFDFFVVLLGDEPVLGPQVAFYQRLAARDQDEAADIALEVARQSSPEDAFDNVIVPALCMARQDRDEGALDAGDLRFVVEAAREVAEEVAELRVLPNGNPDERLRVLLCPARDDAEQLAAQLLALTLDPNRWEVKVAGDETLASELVDLVAEFRPAVVVITTLPPGGVSHARYLVTRLRQRFPEVRILVGRWGCSQEEFEARRDSLKNSDGVDCKLGETRKRLTELHPLVTAEHKKSGAADKPVLLGTANA